MARILRADGTIERLAVPASGLSLLTMKAVVGGYIEIVTLTATARRRDVLIVNDDGHRLGLPFNGVATVRYQAATGRRDVILGDVIEAIVLDPGRNGERFL